jgi:tripartite-type tricarboxylate transporter receptor subunit TctC
LPETKARFATFGVEAATSTPEEFAERIAVELPRWRKIIQAAGIRPE